MTLEIRGLFEDEEVNAGPGGGGGWFRSSHEKHYEKCHELETVLNNGIIDFS